MRPGQQAPESLVFFVSQFPGSSGFNEARAASPGIRWVWLIIDFPTCPASMRPGQQAPESLAAYEHNREAVSASMRPGQQAPESLVLGRQNRCKSHASMRPGQQAPESGPKLIAPGKVSIVASMRPGQQAPESSKFAKRKLYLQQLQ